MRIVEHRLQLEAPDQVRHLTSPNQGGEIRPRFLVIHYTAGPSAARAAQTLTRRERKASAHLVIGREGEIYQLVHFNRRAWHAGASSWRGVDSLNGHSIGIELSNPGRLRKTPVGYQTHWGSAVPDELVFEAPHKNGGPVRGWHTYTEAQLDTLDQVAELLFDAYRLEEVVGHEDISPGRKNDPGPAFPMGRLRALTHGREEDGPADLPYADDVLFATTTALNIRRSPSSDADKLAASPLPEGTRVAVVGEDGPWRRVDVLDPVGPDADLEGWVHGRFIRRA